MSWLKDFKSKFKIVILHPETYEEKGGFKLSKMNFWTAVVVYSLIIIAITTCVIVYTPLREFIPGYTDVTLSRRLYNMEQRADSIEEVFRQKDLYIENLKRIVSEEDVSDENIRQYIISNAPSSGTADSFKMPAFFVPINGLVTNHFNSNKKHFGIDVVSSSDAVIKATADGTVIFSDWSVEGGYVIGIQHDRSIVSIYKHNATLLHHEGDAVRAGDAIAVVGGGGTTSTGPHLHFELWFNGHAMDPEDYVAFEVK